MDVKLDMDISSERKSFIIKVGVSFGLFLLAGIIVGSYIAFLINSPEHNTSNEALVNIFTMIIDYSPLMIASIGAILGVISKTHSNKFGASFSKTFSFGFVSGLLGYIMFLLSVLAIISYFSPSAVNYITNIDNFWFSFLMITLSSSVIYAFSTLFFSFIFGKLKSGRS